MMDVVVERLHAAFARPLPGAAAHALMAPRPRREWPEGFNPSTIRHAAGLLLVYPIDGRAHIVLTVRADTLRHGGQVSMPGGVAEPGETYEQAALREAEEEVGLVSTTVRVLGALTPLDIPASGFRLHPIVGVVEDRPTLTPADGEVARILEVGVSALLDPAHRGKISIVRSDRTVMAPAFRIGNAEVWGATAMVLAEFLALLGFGQSAVDSHQSAVGTDD
jgi:8-oxo-dGTP pyrophosphatase MutT (NUDIX family)